MNTYEKIYAAVRRIPEGRVSTYGAIAILAGIPGGARVVGNALHVNPDPFETECFRVVNAKGRLAPQFAFGGPEEQKKLLEADGIKVVDNHVDLKKYLWTGDEND